EQTFGGRSTPGDPAPQKTGLAAVKKAVGCPGRCATIFCSGLSCRPCRAPAALGRDSVAARRRHGPCSAAPGAHRLGSPRLQASGGVELGRAVLPARAVNARETPP